MLRQNFSDLENLQYIIKKSLTWELRSKIQSYLFNNIFQEVSKFLNPTGILALHLQNKEQCGPI